MAAKKRLPDVKSLYELLPKGTEGGKEFGRIIDILLFHEARRAGKKLTLFSDAAGDYHGLDSFEGDHFRIHGTIGYQYKFYPSPLNPKHRDDIEKSLERTAESQSKLKLSKWILVTPHDLIESSTRKDGGDVTWFEGLRDKLHLNFELEHWGHKKLISIFLETRSVCLYYYPELLQDEGTLQRRTIQDTRERYNDNLITLYRKIEFVGMSVYKPDATKGVPMEHIYIPLKAVPENADERDHDALKVDPLIFLVPGSCYVILGDPGSGKSTLLRFLALVGQSKSLQERYKAKRDTRLPIFITLRRYADELKSRNLSLIDYIQESIQSDFSLKSADLNFFEYYLESGQAILLFDGLDELPNPQFKLEIRNRIRSLITTYPGNTTIVTSRIVGYGSPFRFDDREFSHFRLAQLQLPEIEQFVRDWYRVRIENKKERDANVDDLVDILRDEDHTAIRELAQNPLLLTIVALVHRIDAVLPDERVVLYQKCTETLMNTWHKWKYRDLDKETKNKARIDRKNRSRMEYIAYWMHIQSGGKEKNQRAVVPYEQLKKILMDHIIQVEKARDIYGEPEDIADAFLKFVKEKAGLLIEVGDNQYSFVHLTFQEYLTASYIINKNEPYGTEGIWNEIKDHLIDSRWHEVIRLLVATLKNDNSQEIIINKILGNEKNGKNTARSLLLAGFLIDGIGPAEIKKQDILYHILESLSLPVDDHEQYRPLIQILRNCVEKDKENEHFVSLSIESLLNTKRDSGQKASLALTAISIGWSVQKVIGILGESDTDDYMDGKALKLFFNYKLNKRELESLKPFIYLFWSWQDYMSIRSPNQNLIAASLQSIDSSLGEELIMKRAFDKQLILLAGNGLIESGPFLHYTRNILAIDGGFNIKNYLDLPRVQESLQSRNPARSLAVVTAIALALNRDIDLYLDIEKILRSVMNLDRTHLKNSIPDHMYLDKIKRTTRDLNMANREIISNRVRNRIKKRIHDREMFLNRNPSQNDQILDIDMNHEFYRNIEKNKKLNRFFSLEAKESWWSAISSKPDMSKNILDISCRLFNLGPKAQWWEALRVGFLPGIPHRILLFDDSYWTSVEKAFDQGKVSNALIYSAAWQLIFDIWLYMIGYHNSPLESVFCKLSDLTRNRTEAPLCIANCLRDVAYGMHSRIKDLIAMIEKDDLEYRAIFERCYWRD